MNTFDGLAPVIPLENSEVAHLRISLESAKVGLRLAEQAEAVAVHETRIRRNEFLELESRLRRAE